MEPLCHRAHASCGACCGIYNRRQLSRDAVDAVLARRTTALACVPRTLEAFRSTAARLCEGEDPPLFPSVQICPLLGYLDEAHTRVGCLGHPLATGGTDLRDAGAYGASTCGCFFCPSHAWLSEEEADLVADVCGPDPYLYGLVVTDVPFVRAALAAVAALAGRRVERRHRAHAPFKDALARVLALKEELAPGSDGLFGAFRPGEHGEPLPRTIDHDALGRAAASCYDELLTCVGADPRSGNDLAVLEEEVRRRLEACAAALPEPP